MSTVPEIIGRYEIRGEVGRGGMGSVLLGYDKGLDRLAAIKVLSEKLSKDQAFVERFRREARAAAAAFHPNITQIFELSEHDGLPFFAMEFVKGSTLRKLIRESRGKFDVDEALRIIGEAAKGLAAAASKNLIHRDMKPSNILLAEEGSVKVTDFGLARALEEATRLTAADVILGTPNYVSPEQARGDEEIDFRADMYSLGVTLYETLTGRIPFNSPKPMDVLLMQVNDEPPAISSYRKGLHTSVIELVHRLMNKNPNDRFASYGELIKAIEEVRVKVKEAPVEPPHPDLLKETKRVQEFPKTPIASSHSSCSSQSNRSSHSNRSSYSNRHSLRSSSHSNDANIDFYESSHGSDEETYVSLRSPR